MSSSGNKNQIISFLTLRTLIGVLGLLLPFLLVLFDSFSLGKPAIEPSISDYYDNGAAGDILVGVLFVLGFFLLSYKGYEKIDNVSADLGCVFALGVALFPTTSENKLIHNLHFVFAFLLFSTFIFFALVLFRKTDKIKKPTQQKLNRNRVFLICGIIMILSVLGIILSVQDVFGSEADRYSLIFWFETAALIAFGFSWLVKGEVFWKDIK